MPNGFKVAVPATFTDSTLPVLPDPTVSRSATYDADSVLATTVGVGVGSLANSLGTTSNIGPLTATGTSQPTRQDAPNGHAALRWDGVNDRMLTTAFGTPIVAPFTMAWLFKPISLPATAGAPAYLLSGSATAGQGILGAQYLNTGAVRFGIGGTTGLTSAAGVLTAGAWHVVLLDTDGAGSGARIYVNALTAVASTAAMPSTGDPLQDREPNFTVGSNGGGTANVAVMDLQFFGWWSAVLSTAVRTGVMRGLAARAGLTLGA